jgi:hypothetical protein
VAPLPPESLAAAAASPGLAVRFLFPPPFPSRDHAGWPNGAQVCCPLCTSRGKYHSADEYAADKMNCFLCEKPCATHVLGSSSRRLWVTLSISFTGDSMYNGSLANSAPATRPCAVASVFLLEPYRKSVCHYRQEIER